MTEIEELGIFLPRYLSEVETQALFNELKAFPDNMDERIYTSRLKDEPNAFQGDVIADLPVLRLPDEQVKHMNCMLLSNTCDVSPDNKRLFPSQAVYAAMLRLKNYQSLLSGKYPEDVVNSHLQEIKRQRVTSMLYLPAGGDLEYESIVLLDSICSCSTERLYAESFRSRRLVTLSDYGFYLFLVKLSIHFSRIRESVRRS